MSLPHLFSALHVRQAFNYIVLKQSCFKKTTVILGEKGTSQYFERMTKDKDAIPFPSSKANGRDAAG